MTSNLSETDIRTIREGIRRKYAEVAVKGSASACFRYPTGKEGLQKLGYPEEIFRELPDQILASFCGVGNPFTLGSLNLGETVLDIGCGVGVDSLVAAHLVGPQGRVVGIDATEAMVEQARRHRELAGLTNVNFEVASAEALPFPDRTFDAVISNGVFNLTLDKEQALREARRVLKPGGRLMIADMVLIQKLPGDKADKVENWFQ